MFNFYGLWGGTRPSAATAADSLDAFAPETSGERGRAGRRYALNAREASIALVLVAIGYGVHTYRNSAVAPGLASLTVESDPSGALVLVHGMPKGVTPLTMQLPPGEHPLTLEYDQVQKAVRVTARAEASVVHHVQFDSATDPATTRATATRATAPTSARAPVPAAATAGPVAGWLSVASDIPLQVVENGQVVGTTASERIMLPAGKRTLRFVNDALGFTTDRTVQVGPGKTLDVAIAVPRAPLSINAVPWAEVWIDGTRVGETPIGNHMVPLGSREIVLRHPQFGERRQFATVTLKGPARVSVDLRK